MTHLVYIARSPSNKIYVGITNNFKRRLKEHGSSPYPFGRALRKYGKANFTYEFINCKDLSEAYEIEELLIGPDEVKDKRIYNIACGGRQGAHIGERNPMKRPEVWKNHPSLFTKENNPMNNPEIKAKALKSGEKYKKPVSIKGARYNGVREAARDIGFSRQRLVHRLKSDNYKDHYYV